jgi:isochorismate pyruvate lyase
MERKAPADCTTMAEVRAEIDKLDDALVGLIAQRFGYVDRAWQLKQAEGREGAYVPWRIQQVIDRVRDVAARKGLPPEMVDMVGAQWRNMIGWFVQYEEEKLRKGLEDSGVATGEAEGLPQATSAAAEPGSGHTS